MHYRLLLRIEDKPTRNFYLAETIECSWSSRQLERQINSFYYQRLLASKDKKLVKADEESNNQILKPTDPEINSGQVCSKNPNILEFL
jgi:predicted nuclease of restriction endonuclease-like (RecB) superfamily